MKFRRILGAVAVAGLSVGVLAPSAFAADSVTQILAAGTRTASVANLAMAGVTYSHNAQTNTGSMTLTADDSTGSGGGWNVTVLSSAFVYSGVNSGTNIAATNFSLSSAAAPVSTAGQAIDVTGGPKVPTASPVGTLDTARKVVQADASFGSGTYTQGLGVSLAIPAQSRAGTYTGTLTTTIAAAP
jgi:hypothetical protein